MAKTKHELWVDFSSKAPAHLLMVLKDNCKLTGVKLQHFIAAAIEEKLERTKPKNK